VLGSFRVFEQDFEILTALVGIEIIAVGSNIRDLRRLVESYGDGRDGGVN